MLNCVIFHHYRFGHLRLSYLMLSNFVRFYGISSCIGFLGQFHFDSSKIKLKHPESKTILRDSLLERIVTKFIKIKPSGY